MKRRVLCWLLAVVLAVSIVPGSSFAATIVDGGNCGEDGANVTWTLDSEGTLSIKGTGGMARYDFWERSPWDSKRNSIRKVVIQSGVTTTGEWAFGDCINITSVKIPDSVTSIGYCSFMRCTSLNNVMIPSSVILIDKGAFGECTSLTDMYYGGTEKQWSENKLPG